jgi:hypothetical protein
MKTGWIAYFSRDGELPISLAFEADEAAARDAGTKMCADLEIDPDEMIVEHVDLHDDRDLFDPEDWLLFGHQYTDGIHDVAVAHGTPPKASD